MKHSLQIQLVFAIGITLASTFILTPKSLSETATATAAPKLSVPDSEASTESEMKRYSDIIQHTKVTIDMTPIPGGKFLMGSPESEEDRNDDEGPQRHVTIEPFWMSTCEISWDAFEIWMFDMDVQRRTLKKIEATEFDLAADEYQISQPTPPYTDMTFDMGQEGYPAICMTQLAARVFCQWLSAKTGRYYRLPTEAEWEYACRAGSTTAYHFGDDPDEIEEYGWHEDNSLYQYQQVGQKKPNAWGLHDMHGNVAEWVLDAYLEDYYGNAGKNETISPLAIPMKLYPRVVRGGSWDQPVEELRSAVRAYSEPHWKDQDPQIPRSIWYHTDALYVGFRIVRPLLEPSEEDKANKWDKSEPFQDRKGGR